MSLFIVLEGIDGTGKGTQMRNLLSYLKEKLGEDAVVETKDPGGTPLGSAIREIMYEKVPMKSLAHGVVDLLFNASHLQNWQTVVKPALAEGKVVVSDRWWYSQEVYAMERIVPYAVLNAYEKTKGQNADLLLFFYGDAEKMVERARARTEETHQAAKVWNDVDVLYRIQNAYIFKFNHLAEWHPICIDGKDPAAVWHEVQAVVEALLASRGFTGIC